MPASSLSVWLGDTRVGTINALGGDRSIFAFDDAYADDPSRPTLGLGFKQADGRLIRDFDPTQTRLAPFFSNLLPEGPLRDYLAKRAGVKEMRELMLLEALGHDLPGAIRVRAFGDAIADDAPSMASSEPRPGPLRFSLAGVQLKFSAVEKAHGGLTIPATGEGGDWIVKLPSMRFGGVAANEFSMMTLAAANGLEVPEVRMVPLDRLQGLPEGVGRFTEDAFAVRRFDRAEGGARIHIEDFAQVFGVYPGDKYERASYRSVAAVLAIETGDAGVEEFIRRLVFNTLIGNGDMHLKNWSLIYRDGRTPQLAPAYDFVATTPYIPTRKLALSLGKTKVMTRIGLDQIGYMAVRAGIAERWARNIAKDAVVRFRDIWARENANLPMGDDVSAEIERLLAEIPLANES